MISTRLLGLLMFCCSVSGLSASPRSDLSSTNQETREAAAKILRATYTPPPRTKWDALVASLKIGASKTNVLSLIRPFIVHSQGGAGSGTFEACQYRLDDLWILECHYDRDIFSGCKLFPGTLEIWAVPPPGFTGLWRTYYVNGQKSMEIHYVSGKHDGEFTTFYDDGSRAVLTHFVADIQEGEDTGYFRSGKLNYRGVYKANAQVGTWTWFNEDGTIRSTKEQSKP
ncbi:MAG: hypothetical protein JWR69_2163 [Pedosphaera sp.]|nr:hypothetical protein [Pedosphaera sp.]